jgi:hypothetical protein
MNIKSVKSKNNFIFTKFVIILLEENKTNFGDDGRRKFQH